MRSCRTRASWLIVLRWRMMNLGGCGSLGTRYAHGPFRLLGPGGPLFVPRRGLSFDTRGRRLGAGWSAAIVVVVLGLRRLKPVLLCLYDRGDCQQRRD